MTTTATVSYNGDGSSNLWTVPFAYLKKSHVKLVVDGVEDTTFTWVTDSSIAATTTPPVGVNNVTISRQTPRSALDTTIPASGTFRGADINNQSLQALYVAEEGYDALVNILSLDTADNKWDADSKVLKNLAAPGSDNDAARKVDVDTVAGSASAAAASATSAATSASSASTSASAASTSASNALASENAAATSETNAATSESNAATSASAASTSATNAATSASNASTSATNAASSASAASTSASNAASSESAAATSASNASTSETNAATSATAAAASAAEFAGFQVPGGRLTATSGDMWNATQVTAGTAIYYTPVYHGYVPLYNGTAWAATAFTELTNTFSDATKNPAATSADKNYDLFIWNDSGTVRLSRGPAWTNDTTRSAGTALTTLNGRYVNNTAITNGPAANRGLYVGSFRTNGSNQLESSRKTNGTACNFLLWNYYNQIPIVLLNDFSGGSHTYGTNSTRRFAGDTTTDIGVLQGVGTSITHGRADITSSHAGTQRGTFGMGVSANTVTLVGAYADTDGSTHTSTFLGFLEVPIGLQSLRTLETAPTGTYTGYRSDSKATVWWVA